MAVALPFTPLAGLLGFTAPPPSLLLLVALLVVLYLVCAEMAKRIFYRRSPRAKPALATRDDAGRGP